MCAQVSQELVPRGAADGGQQSLCALCDLAASSEAGSVLVSWTVPGEGLLDPMGCCDFCPWYPHESTSVPWVQQGGNWAGKPRRIPQRRAAGQRGSVNAPRRCPIRSMPFARSSAAGRGWRWPVKLICLHRVWTALQALGWALGSQRGQLWIFAPTKGREKRCRETWVRGTRLCCGF